MAQDSAYFVHPTACIDEPCEIGAGTRIWHFSHIMKGARIGKDCILGQNVYIDQDVAVGDGCKIQNNVSVYKGIILEDGVFCGPSMVFTNVINPRAFIERKSEFKTTLVQKGATLGANATIICGVTVGAYALIGAGSVVTKDVPAHAMIYGVPARQGGWVCRCGVSLPVETLLCPECGSLYHLDENGQLRSV
jgi:UDP-2-acetamido-3-amino-2,3-dideoxy-glucuronate N-acetyltransferase